MKKLLIIIGVTIGLNTSVVAGPIHEAAKIGDIEEIKSLISIGVSVDHKSTNPSWAGATALFFSIAYNKFEVADYLISIGADVNAELSSGGDTPLFNVLNSERLQYLHLLIDNGADVNHQNKFGDTPIFHQSVTPQSVNVLILNGADINHQNKRGQTPLMLSRDVQTASILICAYPQF